MSRLYGPNAWMYLAIEQALDALAWGDVPIGAVIIHNDQPIAVAGNKVEQLNDPTAHAEMLVIQQAARALGAPRLPECDLYVTLEPCSMCATAISFARIRRLYFGAFDPKGGGVDHGPRIFDQKTCHHSPEIIGGLEEQATGQLLKDFFKERRD